MVSQVSRAAKIFLGVSELSTRNSNRILIEVKRVDTHEQRTKSPSDNFVKNRICSLIFSSTSLRANLPALEFNARAGEGLERCADAICFSRISHSVLVDTEHHGLNKGTQQKIAPPQC